MRSNRMTQTQNTLGGHAGSFKCIDDRCNAIADVIYVVHDLNEARSTANGSIIQYKCIKSITLLECFLQHKIRWRIIATGVTVQHEYILLFAVPRLGFLQPILVRCVNLKKWGESLIIANRAEKKLWWEENTGRLQLLDKSTLFCPNELDIRPLNSIAPKLQSYYIIRCFFFHALHVDLHINFSLWIYV